MPGAAGVEVTVSPGPSQLPANEAVNETIVASVLVAPAIPPCRDPGPINVPALSGSVRDGTAGFPISNAPETLTPTTGEANPGPINFGFLGLFAWPTLAPGGYSLDVAAPRYRDPGPIQVTKDPGPMQFGDGSSVAFGTSLDIQLAR